DGRSAMKSCSISSSILTRAAERFPLTPVGRSRSWTLRNWPMSGWPCPTTKLTAFSPTISGAYCGPRKPEPKAPRLRNRTGAMLAKPGRAASGGLQLLGDERAEDGILDRPAGRPSGAHQVGGAAVVRFLRLHGADDRELVAMLGELRQVLAEAHARRVRGDFLERSTVGVSGFEVERVHLAGPAVHP